MESEQQLVCWYNVAEHSCLALNMQEPLLKISKVPDGKRTTTGMLVQRCRTLLPSIEYAGTIIKNSKVPDGKRTTTGMLVQRCRTLLPSIEYAGIIIKNQQSPRRKANNNWYAGTTLQNTL